MMDILSRNIPVPSKMEFVQLPVDRIRPNPYQPRKVFDHIALEELAASIKVHGVMQPVTVRRVGALGYELVAGERRLRASKLAALSEIPAIIVDISDNESAILALIENLQRQDLRFMEEAESYYHLLNEHGFTQEDLAKKIGKNQSTVANKMRLLKLPPLVKKMIFDNDLTERHARALLKLPDEQLQLKVLKIVCHKKLNVSQTEQLIEKTIDQYTALQNQTCVKKSALTFNVRDMRIFTNTIKQAVGYIKKAGVQATAVMHEREHCIEYVIQIPKN
ncbi:MAG: nucleoid occlusion protein [Hyphomonadaceae bacterium]|nr:nucleoid occlusion protein [Clostridia bacterium]